MILNLKTNDDMEKKIFPFPVHFLSWGSEKTKQLDHVSENGYLSPRSAGNSSLGKGATFSLPKKEERLWENAADEKERSRLFKVHEHAPEIGPHSNSGLSDSFLAQLRYLNVNDY